MQSIHQNVIMDLLPSYIAGEASQETRKLVEEYAKSDPRIAKIIRAGQTDTLTIAESISTSADLEMKTIKKVRGSIRRQMLFVALGTAAFLMIPLLAGLLTTEVNWGIFDFIVMGILISGSGMLYVFVSRISDNTAYRVAAAITIFTGFLIIWINLAVGIIGAEDNPANLLYIVVFLIGLIGAGISRLKPRGLSWTLFIAAFFQVITPVLALPFWESSLHEPPGLTGLFLLNSFIGGLLIIAAILFRFSASDRTK